MYTDLAILGGGAAGLFAAAMAAEGMSAAVLEAGARVGKKLLTTGNGRCNLSNTGVGPAHYHSNGKPADLARVTGGVFGAWPREKTEKVWKSLGFLLKTDSEGRIYPRSEQAAAVLDALRLTCDGRGVETICGCEVREVRRTRAGFAIATPAGELNARALLVTAGGIASAPVNAYDAVRALGHSTTTLFPAICPVRVAPDAVRALKGQRVRAAVRLLADGEAVAQTLGEVQFTENALSGICVMELARHVGEFRTRGTVMGRRCRSVELSLDLLPELNGQEVYALITHLYSLNLAPELFLSGVLPKRIAAWLTKDDPDRRTLVRRIRDCRFAPTGLAPWNQAQVTAGGVALAEVNADGSSRLVPGLFFAGEVLDVDGDCGGYNLQWAWSSAAAAVDAARNYVEGL